MSQKSEKYARQGEHFFDSQNEAEAITEYLLFAKLRHIGTSENFV